VPLGGIWLPVPSLFLLAVVLVAGACIKFIPEGRLRRWGRFPLDRARLARGLRGVGWAVLCSGSYVLVEARVPAERLAVKVRLI
jgi:hypothetical protein